MTEREAKLEQATKLMKWALKSESAARLNAMVALAASEPGIPIFPEQLDADPWLFNCVNGTIELKTGRLREHRRADYITQLCPTPFDEAACCPNWQRFLEGVFEGDRELIDFVRRLFGHSLTGDISEQSLPIFWGGGGNGKSTIVTAVLDTLGPDYAMKANAALLMAHRGERHPTELADLFRKRLVFASEPEQGCRLNESLIKDMTGGEKIRARRMREDFWEFDPTHKVILSTNHKPRVSGTDDGIWRRLRLVPFNVRFVKPDEPGYETAPPERRANTQLGELLKSERPGILAWMVSGCLDWHRHGLTLPDKVRAATIAYRGAEDLVANWIDECCVLGKGYRIRASALYAKFRDWCEQANERAPKQKTFGDRMSDRGFQREISNGTWYLGIQLNE